MRLYLQLFWLLSFLMTGCASLGRFSPLAPVERALLYHPSPFPDVDQIPASLPFEDAWFQAEDGTQLHGWFLGHAEPRAVALFCHGNAGNIFSRGESLKILNRRHGLAVMSFDYRGYGKSEGKPNENGILQDARAARTWLAKRTGVRESDIVLLGRSLGGAVAVDLAQDGARGLVLASTFSSLPETAAHHVPWMLPNLNMTQRLNSTKKIRNYNGPLLQSHGDADKLIPLELGRKLFNAAPSANKKFIVLPGAGHNDPQPEQYRRAFDDFIASIPNLTNP